MGLEGDRATLAAVLSGVDDVNGYPYRIGTPKAGDAWPLVESLDNQLAGAFEVTWRVMVVLPPDERAASEWFDAHHEPIADALLEAFGVVDRIQPATIETEAGPRSAMMFTVRREA